MCNVDQQQVGRKFNLQEKEVCNTPESRTNSSSTSNVGAANNCINIPDYFRSSTNKETDKRENRLLTMEIHSNFCDSFMGVSCFEDTFKLQLREGSHPYINLPIRVAYAPQDPLCEELDRLQKQQIIVLLDVDETSEWCKNFCAGPKCKW